MLHPQLVKSLVPMLRTTTLGCGQHQVVVVVGGGCKGSRPVAHPLLVADTQAPLLAGNPSRARRLRPTSPSALCLLAYQRPNPHDRGPAQAGSVGHPAPTLFFLGIWPLSRRHIRLADWSMDMPITAGEYLGIARETGKRVKQKKRVSRSSQPRAAPGRRKTMRGPAGAGSRRWDQTARGLYQQQRVWRCWQAAAHFPNHLVSTPGTPVQEERVEMLLQDRHLSVPRSDSIMLSP